MSKHESEEIPTTPQHKNISEQKDIARKRNELLLLSEDGEISQSVAQLKKASGKQVLRIYTEYKRQQEEKANAFLTDLLVSKFADLLGGLDAIESSEELEKDLLKDKLLRRDVKNIIGWVTPFLPYLGLLSGGITVGKHVVKKKYSGKEEKKNKRVLILYEENIQNQTNMFLSKFEKNVDTWENFECLGKKGIPLRHLGEF